MTPKEIEAQVEFEIKAKTAAHKEAVKAKIERPSQHPFPAPTTVVSAKIATDDFGSQYIRALVECGENGVAGIRCVNLPPDKYTKSGNLRPQYAEN